MPMETERRDGYAGGSFSAVRPHLLTAVISSRDKTFGEGKCEEA